MLFLSHMLSDDPRSTSAPAAGRYRKEFEVDATAEGKLVYLDFDGTLPPTSCQGREHSLLPAIPPRERDWDPS